MVRCMFKNFLNVSIESFFEYIKIPSKKRVRLVAFKLKGVASA